MLLLNACGCAKSKSTSAIPVSEPVRVVHDTTTCRLTVKPPKRPRAVHLVVLDGRKELSLSEQGAFVDYADALEAYAYRAYRLCGVSP
jgi:hypothetical protein